MVATNDAELRNMLSPSVQEAVDYMTGELLKENENKIERTVYDAYSPSWYSRTADFWVAWDVEQDNDIGNLAGGKFEFKPDRIRADAQENGHSGQHASIVDGRPFTNYLADVIYNGYDMPNNGVHIPKRDAFKKLDRWFSERQIGILFKRGLKAAGFKVTKQGGATKTNL